MRIILLTLVLALCGRPLHAQQAPTTAQARARSQAGANRWNNWVGLPNVRQAHNREIGRSSARANTRTRAVTRRRR